MKFFIVIASENMELHKASINNFTCVLKDYSLHELEIEKINLLQLLQSENQKGNVQFCTDIKSSLTFSKLLTEYRSSLVPFPYNVTAIETTI